MKRLLLVTAFLLPALPACSSAPPTPQAPAKPAWFGSPARFEGGGWIVFIGAGEDRTLENARFKARAFAFQNIANECTFVPKGMLVDGAGYDEEVGIIHRSYVKVAVPADRCAAARAALTPDQIRAQADPVAQADLYRYQTDYDPPESVERSSATAKLEGDSQFYTLRERLALSKQESVLSVIDDAALTPRIAQQNRAEQDYEKAHIEMVTEARAYSDYRLNAYAHAASAVRDTMAERARLANQYPPTPIPETRPARPRGGPQKGGRHRRGGEPMPSPTPTPAPSPMPQPNATPSPSPS